MVRPSGASAVICRKRRASAGSRYKSVRAEACLGHSLPRRPVGLSFSALVKGRPLAGGAPASRRCAASGWRHRQGEPPGTVYPALLQSPSE
eukprot:scaffold2053_cov342-Prasinococcus_capsulatus_cf.AAC.2